MNITATIEIKDQNEYITTKHFEYEYETTKNRFIEKMVQEVKDQMGQNVSAGQMEEMMQKGHPKAVFDFAVCSDWIIDHIKMIADSIRNETAVSYKVIAFELINGGGVAEVRYDSTNNELRDMLTYMNKDFNEMIQTA